MPQTRQPFSRSRSTSGEKSESDETITTTSGRSATTRSIASTASAMSVEFLPAARLTIGRIECVLNSLRCLTAASAVQYARRTWMAPYSAVMRVSACSMMSDETLSASISSATRVCGMALFTSADPWRLAPTATHETLQPSGRRGSGFAGPLAAPP